MVYKRIINKQLGELLIEQEIITQGQLEKALALQKEKGGLLGELLIENGDCKEEDVAQALTVQYGFPFLPLGNYEISSDIISMIPFKVARQYLMIPVDKIGNNLTMGMVNPLNALAVEEAEALTGCSIQTFVCTVSDVKKAIEKYYKK
jgi:type IV pilus assembly protein PilB